jgi:hypothetical protein
LKTSYQEYVDDDFDTSDEEVSRNRIASFIWLLTAIIICQFNV